MDLGKSRGGPVDPGPPRHPRDPIVHPGRFALVVLSALQTFALALLDLLQPGFLPTRQETVS
jgi:hypothetical protein